MELISTISPSISSRRSSSPKIPDSPIPWYSPMVKSLFVTTATALPPSLPQLGRPSRRTPPCGCKSVPWPSRRHSLRTPGTPDTCSLLADPTVTRCPGPPGRRLVTGARSSVSPGRQASWLCMLGASGERRHLGGGLGRTTCGSRERPDPGPCRRHRQRIRPYAGRPQRGASTHHPLAHVPGPALRRPETAVRRPHAHPSTAHPSSASTSSLASASPGRSKTSPRRALRKRRYPPSVGEECTSM